MSKNQNQKRKAQLAARAKGESFRFQVKYNIKQKGLDLAGLEQELEAELDAICQNGLTDDLFALAEIVSGVRRELGFEPEADKCSLNGTLVPFLLDITSFCPDSASYLPGLFAAQKPLQVTIAYDNEIRNRVVDWVKAHYEGVTTRLGQPILKRQNMVVEFKRVLKA